MTSNQFNTPILFNVFNRLAESRKVFEVIKSLKPKYLFIKADGPRADKKGEKTVCDEVRSIINKIDWECELHTLFFDYNLGCKMAMSRGIDWFFSQVDEGIILEDDCLPDLSFFTFCAELLEKYRDDKRIMMISGNNFQNGLKRGAGSYYFTKYAHIWGWATWKRAWQCYDREMSSWPEFRKQNIIQSVIADVKVQTFWLNTFQQVVDNKIDTWDYQWTYAMFCNNGLAIMPNQNLVSNIGFGENATHTLNEGDSLSSLATSGLERIDHPQFIYADSEADEYTAANIFRVKPVDSSVLSRVRAMFVKR